MKTKQNIFIITLTFIVLSCNVNYDDAIVANELDANLPDIEMDNVSLHFVRGTTLTMEVEKIELYSERKTQEMYGVKFTENATDGEVRMFGRADLASVETDTSNVTITGNILVRSNEDEAEIQSDYLQWLDDERRIEGSEVEKIIVTRDDGSTIEGFGFSADAKERNLSFNRSVVGKLTVDE